MVNLSLPRKTHHQLTWLARNTITEPTLLVKLIVKYALLTYDLLWGCPASNKPTGMVVESERTEVAENGK
jgi:hypothetical protein